MSAKELEADVAIVGAGPVGLTLAMDLGQRGHRVVVLETRQRGEPPNVKCNHVAARTMEQFRRLGVAQQVRDAGLPRDYPNDVVFSTSMTGTELSRIHIPGRETRYSDTTGPDGWWPTPEPPHRINQIYLEPILFAHAEAQTGVTIHHRVEATAFAQDDDGVRIDALELDGGHAVHVRTRHLVGCDGGRSRVRKAMGAVFAGTPVIQRVQSTYIRAPQLLRLVPGERAWCSYAANPRRSGACFAIDGRETWLVHNHLMPDEEDFEAVDRDASIRNILGVGADFAYDIISKEDWIGRRLVADRFRAGNVFIAGDAAHLWVPYAGYGMNAGIADALNLSWHLSAHLSGWAGRSALDAYEIERLPITEQVSRFAMDHAQQMIKARGAVPPRIEEASAEGDAIRAEEGAKSYALNVQQFCCAGPQLRLLLRALAAHRLRRRSAARLLDGRLHALDRARLPRAAFLPRRRPLAVRRVRCRLHAAALRRRRRRAAAARRRRGVRNADAAAGARGRGRAGTVSACARALPRRPAHRLARRCAAGRCSGTRRAAARQRHDLTRHRRMP